GRCCKVCRRGRETRRDIVCLSSNRPSTRCGCSRSPPSPRGRRSTRLGRVDAICRYERGGDVVRRLFLAAVLALAGGIPAWGGESASPSAAPAPAGQAQGLGM